MCPIRKHPPQSYWSSQQKPISATLDVSHAEMFAAKNLLKPPMSFTLDVSHTETSAAKLLLL